MFQKIKRYFSIVVFFLLGFGLLWYITKGQDVGRIWEEFKGAKFEWIGLSLLAGFVSQLLRALRWRIIIESMNYKVRFSDTFYALMVGYISNLAVPRLGEVTRCGALSRNAKVPFNVLAGTVVAERGFDLLSLILLIFLTVLFQYARLEMFLRENVFVPLFNLFQDNIILLIISGLLVIVFFLLVVFYFKKVDASKTRISSKIKRLIQGFIRGIFSLAQIKQPVLFLVTTVFIWFLYFLTVYWVFFAIPATAVLNAADGLAILAMGSLGIVAPVPGGIGTYHFIVIKTLTEIMGIASEPATSYAYIAHASQTIIIILLGGISWFMLSLNVRKSQSKENKLFPSKNV